MGGKVTVYIQASHSRAPLAVGVVRSEPVIPDRVSLSLQSPRAGLTIVHCSQTFIVTPPPEPATAAAACPAAQKVESPRFAKLVRPGGPGCSESRGDLASAASRARFPRVGEIWRRRQKGTSVCGTCTFFVFRAPSWDLGNATLSSKTECTAVYSRHTRLLWTLSDGGMPMIAIWLQRRLSAGRQAWWGQRVANAPQQRVARPRHLACTWGARCRVQRVQNRQWTCRARGSGSGAMGAAAAAVGLRGGCAPRRRLARRRLPLDAAARRGTIALSQTRQRGWLAGKRTSPLSGGSPRPP